MLNFVYDTSFFMWLDWNSLRKSINIDFQSLNALTYNLFHNKYILQFRFHFLFFHHFFSNFKAPELYVYIRGFFPFNFLNFIHKIFSYRILCNFFLVKMLLPLIHADIIFHFNSVQQCTKSRLSGKTLLVPCAERLLFQDQPSSMLQNWRKSRSLINFVVIIFSKLITNKYGIAVCPWHPIHWYVWMSLRPTKRTLRHSVHRPQS